MATHEDISERMRAQRELDKTRAFLDTIIDNVPTPVIVKSLPEMRYLLVNKEAEKFFGKPREQVIGKTVHEMQGREAADEVHARDLELLRAGREIVTDEHTVLTPAGEQRVMTSTRLPIPGPDGEPQYLLSLSAGRDRPQTGRGADCAHVTS